MLLTFFKAFYKMNKMSRPRNILKLSSEEKRQFLNSFDFVFSDIDGVVWNLAHVIKDCDAGYKALRDAGKHVTFITNNSVRPEEQCLRKLKHNNIEVEAHDLMHPAKSIVEYLKSIKFEGLIYILAADNFKTALRNEGFQLLDGPNEIIEESFEDLLAKVATRDAVKAVVIDFDFNLTLTKMMRAHHFLRKPDCLLIGGASDCLLPVTTALSLLGPGGFVKVLEQSTGRELLQFGKPGKALADVLMKRFNIKQANRALMIGDMLDQDIRFAQECGFQSLLVLSGGSSFDDMMAQTDPSVIPNYYANSIADFAEFMKDIQKSHA